MKVKYIARNKKESGLTINSNYFVVGVEFSSVIHNSSDHIQFRILDNELRVLPYNATDFEIIDGNISPNWEFINRRKNDYRIMPKKISYNSFWEDYYNGDKLAEELLNEVYIELISVYASENEIKEMISSKDSLRVINAIKALRIKPENTFDELLIERVKCEIRELMLFSDPKINPLIVETFEYLSKKSGDTVEELFLSYYENIFLHCEKMDTIVKDYFFK